MRSFEKRVKKTESSQSRNEVSKNASRLDGEDVEGLASNRENVEIPEYKTPKARKKSSRNYDSGNNHSEDPRGDREIDRSDKFDYNYENSETSLDRSQPTIKREATGVIGLLSSILRNDLMFNMGYSTNVKSLHYEKDRLIPFLKDKIEGWILNIKVVGLSSLQVELGMVQPIVRIHTVDLRSGRYVLPKETHCLAPVETKSCYLSSTSTAPHWNENIQLQAPLTLFFNANTLILFELLDIKIPLKNNKSNKSKRALQRIAWAFIRPFGDDKTVNFGYPHQWDRDSLTKDENSYDKGKFKMGGGNGKESTNGNILNENEDGSKEIKAQVLCQEVHNTQSLQLYSFHEDNILEGLQRKFNGWNEFQSYIPLQIGSPMYDDVPETYIQWRRRILKKIPGVLSIQVGARVSQSLDCFEKVEVMPVYEEEEKHRLSDAIKTTEDAAFARMRMSMMKINRGPHESCSLPQKLLHRISVGSDGAMTLSFSMSGSMLAVAGLASDNSSSHIIDGSTTYALRIYCPNSGTELWSDLAAHHGVVYQIKWSNDDTVIVTCSGDGTSKVWDMKILLTNHVDGVCMPSLHSMRAQLLQSVASHQPPVFVYCVAVIYQLPQPSSIRFNAPTYLTGAYDGRIRIWKGDLLRGQLTHEGENQPPHLGAVHSLVVDERTKHLFSGDSVGVIYVWRPDTHGVFQLLRKFRRDDLEGKNIMSLQIHPDRSKAQIFVFAEPSTLRLYSLSNYKVQSELSGAYVQGSFAKATVSADGRYVICGAEDNRGPVGKQGSDNASFTPSSLRPSRIKVWESQSGNLVSSTLSDIAFPYSIRDISWNCRQHMIAIATAGSNTSVSIFVSEKECVLKTLQRNDRSAATDYFQSLSTQSRDEKSVVPHVQETINRPLIDNRLLMSVRSSSSTSMSAFLNPQERMTRTAEILARMREKKRGENDRN